MASGAASGHVSVAWPPTALSAACLHGAAASALGHDRWVGARVCSPKVWRSGSSLGTGTIVDMRHDGAAVAYAGGRVVNVSRGSHGIVAISPGRAALLSLAGRNGTCWPDSARAGHGPSISTTVPARHGPLASLQSRVSRLVYESSWMHTTRGMRWSPAAHHSRLQHWNSSRDARIFDGKEGALQRGV